MTTQTEALKLALEALDNYDGQTWEQTKEAITAIKEALAQPEQKPVAKPTCSDERPCLPCYLDQGKCSATQEPAYWLGYGLQAHTEKPFEGAAPLYTRPQPKAEQEPKREWVGLTDEEIMDVAFNFDVPSISLRTIEAKLKEKNA